MKNKSFSIALAILATVLSLNMSAQPLGSKLWNDDWTFTKDGKSRVLNLPHDWGVDGPFVQDYPGESGKLAWWGKAEYSKILSVEAKDLKSKKQFFLDFGGVMSYAKVFCNNEYVTEWPYGYSSFRADLTPYLKAGDNLVKVTLDNPEESSRWYPGGGIYRNVYLTVAEPVGVAQWGTFVTTKGKEVCIDITLRNAGDAVSGTVRTEIFRVIDPALMVTSTGSVTDGAKLLASEETKFKTITDDASLAQKFTLEEAEFWSPEHPALYQAVTTVTTKDG
ncbi:MAG TPA: hypothetical protein DD383_01495, partial [Rikenellaceae bacterium]|nr:hypothetical protein [Rikenellaceae bacterium]